MGHIFIEIKALVSNKFHDLFDLIGACFCYQDRCEFILNTSVELAQSQANLDQIIQTCVLEEVENIAQELTKR